MNPPAPFVLIAGPGADPEGRLESLLSGEGCRIGHAACSRAAARIAGRRHPALLIADARLADLAWVDLVSAVKAASPATRIVLVTNADPGPSFCEGLEDGGGVRLRPVRLPVDLRPVG